jgi:hypothetical protein
LKRDCAFIGVLARLEEKMSAKNIGETQRLIKFVEHLPFTEEDKKAWLEELHANGINEELVDAVQQKFLSIDTEKLGGDWGRARENMEITGIKKQLRLSLASKNFRHSR